MPTCIITSCRVWLPTRRAALCYCVAAWVLLSPHVQVIVPLVYRPAIKSAMLAAPLTSTLVQLLGERDVTRHRALGDLWEQDPLGAPVYSWLILHPALPAAPAPQVWWWANWLLRTRPPKQATCAPW